MLSGGDLLCCCTVAASVRSKLDMYLTKSFKSLIDAVRQNLILSWRLLMQHISGLEKIMTF